MRVHKGLVIIGLVAVSAAALSADVSAIRPGRWEVTVQLDFGAQKVPAGLPFAEPMTEVSCVTKEELEQFSGFVPPPEEGCQVSNYKATSKEISYLMKCDDVTADLNVTVHSPDSYSGTSTSHGEDPTQKLVMKFSGKRIGDACSAKELAESREE